MKAPNYGMYISLSKALDRMAEVQRRGLDLPWNERGYDPCNSFDAMAQDDEVPADVRDVRRDPYKLLQATPQQVHTADRIIGTDFAVLELRVLAHMQSEVAGHAPVLRKRQGRTESTGRCTCGKIWPCVEGFK